MDDRNAIAVLVLGTLLQFIGVILHITGIATPHWMNHVNNDPSHATITSQGLFSYCTPDGCYYRYGFLWINYFVIAGTILGCLATLFGVLFIIQLKRKRNVGNRKNGTASAVNGMVSGILLAIVCIYYKAVLHSIFSSIIDFTVEIGYSFYLSVSGLSLIFLGSFITVYVVYQLKPPTPSVPSNGTVTVVYI